MYTIKELERVSGIKTHTLRAWERRYNLLQPHRTDTNIRRYDDDQLIKLLNVAFLLKNGWKISQVGALSSEELIQAIQKVDNKEPSQQYDIDINELINHSIKYDERNFDKKLTTSFLKIGVTNTMLYIVYPFLKKIGLLWQTNKMIPSQEHFASILIKQKLYIAIDNLPILPEQSATSLLFLPENEFHELGLLFANYLFRSLGMKTIYLGGNVPFLNVIQTAKSVNPKYLFSILTIAKNKEKTFSYLNLLLKETDIDKILISGYAITSYKDNLPEKCEYLHSPSDLQSFIGRLH